MDNKIGFEMMLIVVEAIRGRCEGLMILTATVSEIFDGQTNSSNLVGGTWLHNAQYTFRANCFRQ